MGGSYLLLDHDGTALPRAVAPSMMKVVIVNPSLVADTHIVDRILDHRGPTESREYIVRWKNQADDSWERFTHFFDTQCVSDYWQR
jgi:hypothetical protein